jgi:hypothetical protein
MSALAATLFAVGVGMLALAGVLKLFTRKLDEKKTKGASPQSLEQRVDHVGIRTVDCQICGSPIAVPVSDGGEYKCTCPGCGARLTSACSATRRRS